MTDAGTGDNNNMPGWWTPGPDGGQEDHSTLTPGVGGTTGAAGGPAGRTPKRRWPYVALTAISLVVLTAGGTIIALKLGADTTITSNEEEAAASTKKPSTTRTNTSGGSGSSDASNRDANVDTNSTGSDGGGSDVTLPNRSTAPNGSTEGPSSSSGGSTAPASSGGAFTLGPISFDVPSGFSPSVVAERRDDGAIRSEFVGPGGQEIAVEVNVGKTSDALGSAQELSETFRDQGRLIQEPFSTDVDGTTTAVLAVRGTDGDYRSDHFLNFDGNGMAVLAIDLSSFEAADQLARTVVPTLQS